MAFSVDRLDHVEVVVRDIEAACRWYADVLGLQEIYRWDPEPVMIGAGGTMLALFAADPASGASPSLGYGQASTPRWQRVAWRTDRAGFEAAQKHLAAKGVAFRGPVDHDRTWSIYFVDPDGNPLEITCSA